MWWLTLPIALSLSTATASLTYKGVDWSSTLVEEDSGRTYSGLDGTSQPLERIFKDNGVNAVRQRIWNNPSDGNYNLDYNLELGKRANDAGLEVFLDFHYSDTWADPSHQTTPSEWDGDDLQSLASAVKSYTKSVLNSFASADIPLSIVSIGNEITAGLLWPVGDMNEANGPFNVATLLHAASAGVKESNLASQPKILIHLDNGWNWETQKWWYDAVLGEDVLVLDDFDAQGVSYYPFYNPDATLDALETSLGNMRSKYGKEVMVVETNWPESCPNPEYAFPSDAADIPFSTAGQKTWMKEVASVVESSGGNGVFYWEPAWVDNAALGSSCDDNAMFEWEGQARDSISVFGSI
ncbi:hypothetical protein D0869_14920 [Hortaea werneckii]|uniref:Arabinogalactan endo-beta-1,4-galactanase n=1 Tax=Hortaea werneckii TaxID=91943 RepID=A0A3M6W147_HORWE|nr:glycosyl hydrolase 53 [Hortaea werneckii]KAI7589589.1 glycosyl hydrolase 53 [Hortaea werneckii]RMX72141.1 hypothetical protein D0869_14920 [Hortaea werneckii]